MYEDYDIAEESISKMESELERTLLRLRQIKIRAKVPFTSERKKVALYKEALDIVKDAKEKISKMEPSWFDNLSSGAKTCLQAILFIGIIIFQPSICGAKFLNALSSFSEALHFSNRIYSEIMIGGTIGQIFLDKLMGKGIWNLQASKKNCKEAYLEALDNQEKLLRALINKSTFKISPKPITESFISFCDTLYID